MVEYRVKQVSTSFILPFLAQGQWRGGRCDAL